MIVTSCHLGADGMKHHFANDLQGAKAAALDGLGNVSLDKWPHLWRTVLRNPMQPQRHLDINRCGIYRSRYVSRQYYAAAGCYGSQRQVVFLPREGSHV